MTVFLTVDFSGYFEFRLCADKPEAEQLVTQECFDKHLLTLIDGTTRYYMPENYKENSYHNVSVRLPAGDVNCEHCVIQWRYKTGMYGNTLKKHLDVFNTYNVIKMRYTYIMQSY